MCAKQVAAQAGEVKFTVMDVGAMKAEVVNSKDLHGALDVGRAHSHWIADRIERLGLQQGADYHETERGGTRRTWNAIFLTPKAALRVAVAHQAFRGVNTAGKKDLLRQRDALQQALLDARPELRKVLHYEQQGNLSREERATLMGWSMVQWDAAVADLKALGLVASADDHAD